MSLWRIAWRSIQQRGLASLLTSFSMALGVMLVVAVLSIHGVVADSFRNNSSLGYNMIVGAKGGKLQLTLNTVYYLSQPVENVSYDFYMRFLNAQQRDEELKNALRPQEPGRDGRYAPYCEFAIPICLGDYYGPFRVIGTTPDFFDLLTFGQENDRKFEFAQGRNLRRYSKENGLFEAVVGAMVAREMNVKLGDRVSTTHADPEGEGHGRKFTVVGILEYSGTPNDRAAFVNMEGFFLMKDHAKPYEPEEESDASTESLAAELHELEDTQNAASNLDARPLPIEQREVTAILVRTTSPIMTRVLQNSINEGREAQSVLPVREIFSLFEIIVKPVQMTLFLMTAMICIVSGVSILVSIYNSMSERRHEIAVMRALGASRGTVMTVILLESILLAVGGGAIGWTLAHGMNWLVSPLLEQRTGVSLGFFDFAPSLDIAGLPAISPELLLVPALVLLAVLVGFLPALAAYRTDVAKSLGS
ncbi:MAG: ABC transporter permease [Pirellulaceae bacterium]